MRLAVYPLAVPYLLDPAGIVVLVNIVRGSPLGGRGRGRRRYSRGGAGASTC